MSDIQDYVKPSLRKKPDNIILHVGTNDLAAESPEEIVDSLKDLHLAISQISPFTKVSMSALTVRSYKLSTKVNEVNSRIYKYCNETKIAFLNHDQIDKKCLNKSGLHLNQLGYRKFAKNAISLIKSF